MSGAGFYFDLADPSCYPAAELVPRLFPALPLRPLCAANAGIAVEQDHDGLARVVAALGLLPLRLPKPLPTEAPQANLAATYAAQIGKGYAFALAAFRHAYAAGRRLDDPDNVAIVAASCEIHPRALATALEAAPVRRRFEENHRLAGELGINRLPAVVSGERTVCGLEELLAMAGSATVVR